MPDNGNRDPETLEECRRLIARLKEENAHLRESAALFGRLAERLNHTLQEERRRGIERRLTRRDAADRRANPIEHDPGPEAGKHT